MSVVEKSEVRILVECAPDFGETEGMEEVVVIEEGDNGTSGGSDAVGNHSPPALFLRDNPLSLTTSHFALEVCVMEVRDDDQFNWRSDTNPD